nr:MAG TPA: hypothetical protein [Caudoviricetes sp.]
MLIVFVYRDISYCRDMSLSNFIARLSSIGYCLC